MAARILLGASKELRSSLMLMALLTLTRLLPCLRLMCGFVCFGRREGVGSSHLADQLTALNSVQSNPKSEPVAIMDDTANQFSQPFASTSRVRS